MFNHGSLRSLAAAFVLTLASVPAFAHAHPKTMTPAADSTIPSPPSITITFTEAIEPKFSSLVLTDEKGKTFNKEASQVVAGDPTSLTLALPPLTPGVYVVHWTNVATDGHRAQGEYKFTVQ
jgi:methionine-rich copper-binding protein CopC